MSESERDRPHEEKRRDVPGADFDAGRTPEAVKARTGDRYEHTDVRGRPMIVFMIGVLVALGVVNIVIGGFGLMLYLRHRAATRPRSELTTQPQPFPEPRLQSSPKADMEMLLAEERAMLTSYGWADRKAGLARVPIDRAMELIALRGLPPKRNDIPTTAGAEAAARAAALGTTATAANIRASQGLPPEPAPPAGNTPTTTTRKAGP